jgi:hypothetical protein
MPKHKFKIGERLFLVRSIGLSVSGRSVCHRQKIAKARRANLNIA